MRFDDDEYKLNALKYRDNCRGSTITMNSSTAAIYRKQGGEPVGLDRLEFEYQSWRKEWQYQCKAAVESALFASELEEIAQWL